MPDSPLAWLHAALVALRTVSLQPQPLTCSVCPFLALSIRGPGRSGGSRVGRIWSWSMGRPPLVLFHRGSGIEPRAGVGLRWRRLWARGARRGGAGVHPA